MNIKSNLKTEQTKTQNTERRKACLLKELIENAGFYKQILYSVALCHFYIDDRLKQNELKILSQLPGKNPKLFLLLLQK